MSHLSPGEFVDAVEGRLPAARAAHLAACAACAAHAGAIRGALTDAASVDVPEPSPLFWEHFGARVSDAVRASGRPQRIAWPRPAFAAIALLLAAAIVGLTRGTVLERPAPAAAVNVAGSSTPEASGGAGPEDAAWTLLTDLASDVPPEEVHAAGLSVRLSTVDRALDDLSPVERQELERLLRDDLKRAGA
jgi:hypothetical protein